MYRRLLALAALIYAGALIYPGIDIYFTPDDSTNLYKAWIKTPTNLLLNIVCFWTGPVRPIGQAAYRLMYEAFGWDAYPFRICCFVLLLLNTALVIRLFTLLSPSLTFRILASLLVCYHGALLTTYYSTGSIYDILCLTFLALGLTYYIAIRSRPAAPSLLQTAAIVLCTVAAFESKETGFLLPALLLSYELLFPHKKTFRVILPATIVSAIGLAGLLFSPEKVMFGMEAYAPTFTLARYAQSTAAYLHFLFFKTIPVSGPAAAAILIATLLMAVLIRSRLALFGWVVFMLTLLPISFTPTRADGYVLYVPYIGAAIFLAALLLRIPRFHWIPLAAACSLIIWMQLEQRATASTKGFGPGEMEWIAQLTRYANRRCAAWPRNARVAVIGNPFGDDYQAAFVFNLACERRDIRVEPAAYTGAGKTGATLSLDPHEYASIALYTGYAYVDVHGSQLNP